MSLAPLAAALNALKSVKELLESMVALRDAEAFQTKRAEIGGRLIDAQAGLMEAQQERATLVKRVGELEQQIAAFDRWEGEKARYQVKQLAPGAYAYVMRPGMEAGEPAHWLCAACYQDRKKSFLQAAGPAAPSGPERNKLLWRCPACRAAVRVHFTRAPNTAKDGSGE